MNYKDTQIGIITNRYKRFLSDITLANGECINAYVPNTGAMTTCWEKGWKVLISKSDNPKRKMPYTLELTHNKKTWICVNTSITNKLVQEALDSNTINELKGYESIQPEKKICDSRLDFYLSNHPTHSDAYVEVKNVTLLGEDNTALFPDSISTRGQKHLKDLIKIKESGLRAVMLYVVNREDADSFSPAIKIDSKYAELLKEANSKGVEILVYQSKISETEIKIYKKLKVKL